MMRPIVFKLGLSLLCCLAPFGAGCGRDDGARENRASVNDVRASSAATTTSTARSSRESESAASAPESNVETDAKSKSESRGESESGASASGVAASDACALIEKSEVAAVQGLDVQQVQPTAQKSGDLYVSQCYYTVVSADGSKNFSVYVQLIRPDPKGARTRARREFWAARFGREGRERRREAEERGGAREEEAEAINAPVRVAGVGDEAFWLGSSRGGALYVLKRDKESVLRVTAGGEGGARADVEKAKTLAKKALARLN
jgi:hypothetical protein